ncbi:hypothetical protein ACQP2Y_07325 [Actinoplanes sp. CA-051413]|uniref:hypothetical protein n=1 Tax=Actinoplanes sp. CA-051413 TaxID=3239899 RepID=UPI003D95F606
MTDPTTNTDDTTPDDDTQAPTTGPVVTVPTALYAPPGLDADTVTAPVEIASQWDSRAWRRGVPNW